jgi:hypothetical protein
VGGTGADGGGLEAGRRRSGGAVARPVMGLTVRGRADSARPGGARAGLMMGTTAGWTAAVGHGCGVGSRGGARRMEKIRFKVKHCVVHGEI